MAHEVQLQERKNDEQTKKKALAFKT